MSLRGILAGAMTEAVGTPAEALAELPDFPYAPQYREVNGLRLAHLDEGEGAPVIFMLEDQGPRIGGLIAKWLRSG